MTLPRPLPRSRPRPPGSRWSRVALGAAALLVGSVLPVPFGRHPEFRWFGPDKLLHLLGHGGFAAVAAGALGAGRFGPRSAAVLAVPLSTGYAVLLGRLQERVPGREPEPADLVASTVGSVLGVAVWLRRSEAAVRSGEGGQDRA
jgi:VanZ family protein